VYRIIINYVDQEEYFQEGIVPTFDIECKTEETRL
jgi:hypothetical protein